MKETVSSEVSDVPFRENRFKIVSLQKHLIIDMLNWHKNPPGWLALTMIPELPTDCKVVSVNANWDRQCIDAILCSAEFDSVPEGYVIPRYDSTMSQFRVISFKDEVADNVTLPMEDIS